MLIEPYIEVAVAMEKIKQQLKVSLKCLAVPIIHLDEFRLTGLVWK